MFSFRKSVIGTFSLISVTHFNTFMWCILCDYNTTKFYSFQVRSVHPEIGSGKAMLTFYVESPEGNPTSANEVVQHLRQKLRVDAGILGFSVAKLQTAICQNNCSGHGVCNEQTRECECEAFWMRDMFKVYLETDEDSDCSWSILYVVLGMVCGVLVFLGTLWGIFYLCYTWCTKRRSITKPTTYKLIEDTEDLPPCEYLKICRAFSISSIYFSFYLTRQLISH